MIFKNHRIQYYYISYFFIDESEGGSYMNFRDLYVGVKGQIDEEMITMISHRLAEENETDHVAILDIVPIAAPKKKG